MLPPARGWYGIMADFFLNNERNGGGNKIIMKQQIENRK
jgi:hypothetical protein